MMDRNEAIACLVEYALHTGYSREEMWERDCPGSLYMEAEWAGQENLIRPGDRTWAVNAILEVLKLDSFTPPDWFGREERKDILLAPVLETLLDDAYERGVLEENSVVYRDLLDTAIMGRLSPRPSQVRETFWTLYEVRPELATDWYYKFSQDTNYIRRDRIARDVKWKAPTEYGELDITINLSKPEKDPKAIAAAKDLPPRPTPSASSAPRTRATPGG